MTMREGSGGMCICEFHSCFCNYKHILVYHSKLSITVEYVSIDWNETLKIIEAK